MHVPEHSHCSICGTPIDVGGSLCEKRECLDKHQEAQAIKKRSVYLMIGLIVAAVLLSKFVQF